MSRSALTSLKNQWVRLLILAAFVVCIPIASCYSSSPRANTLSIHFTDDVKQSHDEARRIVEFKCAGVESDQILVVGFIGTPDPASPVEPEGDAGLLQSAVAQFACRAPRDGAVSLILDMTRVREAFGDDVTIVAAQVRRITLLMYEDSSVRGGGSRTSREITLENLTDDLRPLGPSEPFAPLSKGLEMFRAGGFSRLIVVNNLDINTIMSKRLTP